MNKMICVVGLCVGMAGVCRAGHSSYYSVALPEGNYRVTAILGGTDKESITTIKAEDRRLMLDEVHVPAGQFSTNVFTVNIRTPAIKGGGQVRLKKREIPYLDWDHKLTLEINGENPGIASLDIEPAGKVTTVYISGDSTVCDQPGAPWNSWGQMLPCFFDANVAVANHAMSGATIRSSLGRRRFDKIFSEIQPGDYLLIQFGHNDMKSKNPNKKEIYRHDLENLVDRTRKHGATPVLVTSMERKAGVHHNTLEGYPQIVREVAKEKKAPLVDLNAMSKVLYKALGKNLDKAFVDGTHHDNYGSYELAQCVLEGLRKDKLPLVKYIRSGVPHFDPSKPDSIADFDVPASQKVQTEKPLGN